MQPVYDNQRHEFTPQDVEIVSKETLFRGFLMVKYTFKHKLFEEAGASR